MKARSNCCKEASCIFAKRRRLPFNPFNAFNSFNLFCLALALHARAATSADLPPWYVDDLDFKPIEVQPWVYERPLTAFADSEADLHRAIDAGLQILHTGGGPIYWPLHRDDPTSGMPAEPAARLRKFVAAAHAHQMKIVASGQPSGVSLDLIKAHPEWLMHRQDDPRFDQKIRQDPVNHPEFCLNSPFGDYYIECLAEILRDYDVDGFSFDGNYIRGLCFCPACKQQYKADTGRDLPAKIDLKNIDYRIYSLWAQQKQEQWHRHCAERLRRVKPQAGLLSWTTSAGRYMQLLDNPPPMSQRMNLLLDTPMMEWWFDEYHRGATILSSFGPAYLLAVSAHRIAAAQPYCMSHGNPYDQTSFPPPELMAEGMLALVNGVVCPPYLGWPQFKTADLLKEIQRRSPWLVRARQEPWAALLVHDRTRQFYGLDQIDRRYLAYLLGMFRAAEEEHFPISVICEWELRPELLSQYKVLILPNAACLSDAQVRTIRNYVQAGGGLVATGETSRFDGLGRERPDFALADLFGVSFQGPLKGKSERGGLDQNFAAGINTEEYFRSRTDIAQISWPENIVANRVLVDDNRLRQLVPGASATFKGPMFRVTPPRAPMQLAALVQPDGANQSYPAAIVGPHDSGRVVYLPTGIDHAYYAYSYPYQRRLLARAIQWAAQKTYPVTVEAPMCVQAGFFRQHDSKGQRLIIHLFNEITSNAQHSQMDSAVPLREEVVPVSGIKVHLAGLSCTRIHLEPEGADLHPATSGSDQVVSPPSLALHAMVVIELNGN
jgi:hypothetical protein